ncbi:MAG TPA: 50S ribosomal protein L1 [Candidatus Moranbacteria bacterium]|nr:50S ribosomal protein L1 [Candidatus Moranbacteria bacterium]
MKKEVKEEKQVRLKKASKKEVAGYNKDQLYPLKEGLEILSKFPKAKFDETVELAIKLSINPAKSDQQMRGAVDLPHGTGKSKKIAAFTETQAKEAKEAGADKVGGQELVDEIAKGKIDFDVAVATPEMMPKLAKVAKILGPKGLMPNPKTETVGPKIAPMIESLKKGRASFKTDKGANIHQIVGKRSFENEKLEENIRAMVDYLNKNKPAAVKGKLIKNISISGTMTPGIKVSL